MIGPGDPQFLLPAELLSGFHQVADVGFQECPLGTLYFTLIHTYVLLEEGDERLTQQADRLGKMLRQFSALLIAGSRWPVYEALHHFRHFHRMGSAAACTSKNTGIDWGQLLEVSRKWSDQGMAGLEPGEGSLEYTAVMRAAMDTLAKDPVSVGHAAQDECAVGFLFICTIQTVAAAVRQTKTLETWVRAVDQILGDLPFFMISASQWPVFQVLAMLSVHSKGPEYGRALGRFQSDIYNWAGAHPLSKRFRAFGDLHLTRDEILPFGLDDKGLAYTEMLSSMDLLQWQTALGAWRQTTKLRPSFEGILDAATQSLRASLQPEHRECGHSGISQESCLQRGCNWRESRPACQFKAADRKVLLTSFVWGSTWSKVIPQFVAWMHKLHLPTVLVVMGKSCRSTCETAVQAVGGWGSSLVSCWDPFYSYLGHCSRLAARVSSVGLGFCHAAALLCHVVLYGFVIAHVVACQGRTGARTDTACS